MRTELVSTDSIQIPKIFSIGYSDDPLVTKYGPSRRNQYIIHYVLSGKGYFNGNKVKAGQGFLITPGMDEEYHSDKNDPWLFLWVISEDSSMAHYFDRHGADSRSGIFNFHNMYVLENAVQSLREKGTSPVSSAFLTELFLRVFNSSVVGGDWNEVQGTNRYINFSVGFIKSNIHLPITVTELCSVVGVSQPYLYKAFMEHVGSSPKKYIATCKLSEAKRLLLETRLRISEVAMAVGFEDALAFSKFFSKNMGVSPTAFRDASLEVSS